MSYGLGGGSRAPIGPSLTKGIGTPGGDDLHLGLSSHELGLGNNFGLDAPDNVLSRAARVGNPPIISGIGRQADDRPSLQGLDLEMTGDSHIRLKTPRDRRRAATAPRKTASKRTKSRQSGPTHSKNKGRYCYNSNSRPNGKPICPRLPRRQAQPPRQRPSPRRQRRRFPMCPLW